MEATARPRRSLVEVRALVGVRGSAVVAADSVNAAMVRQWCDAIGDRNPVYLDEASARRSVHGGLIAPPAMLQAWTMPGFGRRLADDPVETAYELLVRVGYPAIVAVNCEQDYFRTLRPGDRISATRWVENVSDEKQTAIGDGVFVSSVSEVADGNGEPVGRQRYRVLCFRPRRRPAGASGAAGSGPAPRSQGVAEGAATVGTGALSVGDALPPLRVPLTRTLIVAAAIASHDWEPIHHDPAAAHAGGLDDVIMNILSTNGFVGRFVTDWAGPDATLTAIRIRLGVPNYPGDTLELRGTVVAAQAGPDGCDVEVGICGRNRAGDHVTGSAALRLVVQGC